jgi:hypothetical protein
VIRVKNHPNVIHSPIANDTILIKLKGHKEKQRVSNLLLEIPVHELHYLMVAKAEVGGLAVARDELNQIIISNTMLRKILKMACHRSRRQQIGINRCVVVKYVLDVAPEVPDCLVLSATLKA